jgi:lysophospholipase L1-like esterase
MSVALECPAVEPTDFPRKTAFALLWFTALSAATAIIPLKTGLVEPEEGAQSPISSLLWSMLPIDHGAEAAPLPAALSLAASAPAPAAAGHSVTPAAGTPLEVEHPIEDASGHSMDSFYRSLRRTEAREEPGLTRVIHYGDSMLTGDSITGTVRRRLQDRFGDGGHGFVLAGRPWRWYSHVGVRHWNSKGFQVNRITANPLEDGRFGLGAVAFRSYGHGARFFVETEAGQMVSRFELYYLLQPNGGSFSLEVSDHLELSRTISTSAPAVTSGYYEVQVPEGMHRLTVTNAGGGEVRFFGVTVERHGPGVIYDSLGVSGLHTSNFERYNRAHLAEQVAHRAPALIVIMLGTNESENPRLDLELHGQQVANLIEMLQAGAPDASCLIVSPPDRAQRAGRGRMESRPVILGIVERQREVAREMGCGYWNTLTAMGGEGAAASWRARQPPLMGGDLTHPTPEGAEIIGDALADALIGGYEEFRRSEDSGSP